MSENSAAGQLMSGKIKKIVPDKGFGFIDGNSPTKGSDIFFHHSVVSDANFDDLKEGQSVEYTAESGDKGLRATKVCVPA